MNVELALTFRIYDQTVKVLEEKDVSSGAQVPAPPEQKLNAAELRQARCHLGRVGLALTPCWLDRYDYFRQIERL